MRLRAVPVLLAAVIPFLHASPVFAAKTKAKASVPAPAPAPAPEPAPAPPPPAVEPEPTPEPAAPAEPAPAPAAPLAVGPAAFGNKQHVVFLEGGFRWDLGTFSRRENVGQNVTTNNDTIRAFDPAFHVGYLGKSSKVWRLGGAFGYLGNYDLNNNNQLIGQLLTADFRAEASVAVSENFSLLAQPKAGLQLIIPGGILQERIDDNQQFGYDTWSGPRYGFLIGVDVGGRYVLNEWFAIRGTVGYAYTMAFLLDSQASSPDVSASQTWQVQASRVSGNLGVEVGF